MVVIHALLQGIVIVHGIRTRNKYEFNDSNNHILEVDEADAPDILSKVEITGGCCNIPRLTKQMFEQIIN